MTLVHTLLFNFWRCHWVGFELWSVCRKRSLRLRSFPSFHTTKPAASGRHVQMALLSPAAVEQLKTLEESLSREAGLVSLYDFVGSA